jgi:hypothetical protein
VRTAKYVRACKGSSLARPQPRYPRAPRLLDSRHVIYAGVLVLAALFVTNCGGINAVNLPALLERRRAARGGGVCGARAARDHRMRAAMLLHAINSCLMSSDLS